MHLVFFKKNCILYHRYLLKLAKSYHFIKSKSCHVFWFHVSEYMYLSLVEMNPDITNSQLCNVPRRCSFPSRKCWNVPALELIMPINIILIHTNLSVFVIVILTEYILDNLIKESLFTRLPLFFILHLQVFFYLETRGGVPNKQPAEPTSSVLIGAQQPQDTDDDFYWL